MTRSKKTPTERLAALTRRLDRLEIFDDLPLALLASTVKSRARNELTLSIDIYEARKQGCTWEQIAKVLGIPAKVAEKKYADVARGVF